MNAVGVEAGGIVPALFLGLGTVLMRSSIATIKICFFVCPSRQCQASLQLTLGIELGAIGLSFRPGPLHSRGPADRLL